LFVCIDGNVLDVIMVDVLGLTATGPFPHRVFGIGTILETASGFCNWVGGLLESLADRNTCSHQRLSEEEQLNSGFWLLIDINLINDSLSVTHTHYRNWGYKRL
jgi:hypothetical protein